MATANWGGWGSFSLTKSLDKKLINTYQRLNLSSLLSFPQDKYRQKGAFNVHHRKGEHIMTPTLEEHVMTSTLWT